MEQNISPIQSDNKIKNAILYFFLAIILSILFYFLVIANYKISNANNPENPIQKYSMVLKNINYQIILADPKSISFSNAQTRTEFGNKMVLVRNDISNQSQNFLAVWGIYFQYFEGVRSLFLRNFLSILPGFLHYPVGFVEIVKSKYFSY